MYVFDYSKRPVQCQSKYIILYALFLRDTIYCGVVVFGAIQKRTVYCPFFVEFSNIIQIFYKNLLFA